MFIFSCKSAALTINRNYIKFRILTANQETLCCYIMFGFLTFYVFMDSSFCFDTINFNQSQFLHSTDYRATVQCASTVKEIKFGDVLRNQFDPAASLAI